MSGWTGEELQRIGGAPELRLTSRRQDGSLPPFTTIWVVRAGDDLYVRSAGGPQRSWYRAAVASGTGRIQTGGVDAEVEFATAAPETNQEVDSQYRAKYDRYGPGHRQSRHRTGCSRVTIRLIKTIQ